MSECVSVYCVCVVVTKPGKMKENEINLNCVARELAAKSRQNSNWACFSTKTETAGSDCGLGVGNQTSTKQLTRPTARRWKLLLAEVCWLVDLVWLTEELHFLFDK